MSHERDACDVVVIGGGPAGSTAARLLVTWGHTVVLFARHPAALHLAESLPPSCGRLLERLGARDRVDGAGFLRSSGNTVSWAARAPHVEAFAENRLGYQVDRGAFDRLLLEHAEQCGVRVERGVTATGVTHDLSALHEVSCARSTPHGPWRAPWVLDCTGRAGLLARRDGRRQPEAGPRVMAVVGMWERADAAGWPLDDESHTVVESYDDGWGWSVPVSRVRRCVAVMLNPERTPLARRAALGATYARVLRGAPRLASLVHGARLVGVPWGRDATAYFARRPAEAGTLLVGDAASFVDPLSSYGIKKALSSAWLAAVVVHTCLTHRDMQDAALSLYASRERSMYEALRLRAAELARQVAGAHGTGFWDDDALGQPRRELGTEDEEPNVGALKRDDGVLAAFEAIRRRPALRLRAGADGAVRTVRKPTVRDNQVVLEEQLVARGFEGGLRYLRNVDLLALATLAPAHDQVPDLYAAYHRATARPAPVPMPDFLGALSVLVGRGVLDLA